jgi:hypothetical protein
LSNASAYEVDRSSVSASGPFNAVATGITGTAYADKSVSASTQYWYQVIASNSAGAGPASAPFAVTTPAASTALLSNSFEGGTNGAAITAANSGGASGNALSAISCAAPSTLTYSTASAAHGSVSALFTPGTGACAMQWSKAITPTGEAYGRAYFNFAANPAGAVPILKLSDASLNRDVQVNLSTTGKLSLTNSAGASQVTFTNSIPLNSWVRLEWHLISAASGTFELRMYNGDATSPIETRVVTAVNTGTSIGFYQVGALAPIASGFGTTFKVDDLAFGTSGWLGAG